MKRYLSIGAVVVVAACCAAFQSATRAPQPEPKMALIIIDEVEPSNVIEYEQVVGEMIELLGANNVDPAKVGWSAIVGEMGYTYVVPLEDGFASMSTMKADWEQATASLSENWKELTDRANKLVTSTSMHHSVWRTDLSYSPENPRIKGDEIGHVGYTFIYVKPGHQEHFETVCGEFASLYASHNIRQPWNVYQSITGEDLPLYVIGFPAKSALDLAQTRNDIHETINAEAEELFGTVMNMTRRFEHKEADVRRDLSYSPTQTDSE